MLTRWMQARKPRWTIRRPLAGPAPLGRAAAALGLLLTLGVPRTAAARTTVLEAAAGQPLWTAVWQAPVRATPGGASLTQLDIDQRVRAAGAARQALGTAWVEVWLWGTQRAWMRAADLATAPVPARGGSGVPIAPHPVGPHAPLALQATGMLERRSNIRAQPGTTSQTVGQLPAGTPVTVISWATDRSGSAWYHLRAPLHGWVSADQAHLDAAAGTASPTPPDGVGMWCAYWVLDVTSPYALVAAARRHHVTHIYAEMGGKRTQAVLDQLLPIAHRAHIAVIAWVYPFLDNLPLDVGAALAAAHYTAPSGDSVDGLLADVEQNMAEPFVRAYGEILRATLGPQYLMGIATYPPQTSWGKRYPFKTVARSWDYLAPMDYWHVAHRSSSTPATAYRYVATSITRIRQLTGRPDLPIEAIGQMYDPYQDGRHSPSGAEVRAAMQAARDHHAGISFFEWNHATPDEWDALLAPKGSL